MRTSYVVVGLLLLAPMGVGAAEQPEDARAIVDKAIKAQSWTGKGKMFQGDVTLEYTAKYVIVAPDKLRFDLEMEPAGEKIKLAVATDGKAAWEQMGAELRDMPKDKQTEFHHNAYVMNLSRLLPLRDKAFTLTALGESKRGDQTLLGVKVTHEGRRDVSLFFDKKTGLLAGSRTRIKDEFQKQQEVTQDIAFSGYSDKGGVKVFDKLTIQRDGKEFLVEELSAQKVLDKVDAKQFAKPAKDK